MKTVIKTSLFLVHLYQLIQEYFAYDVMTNVIVEQPSHVVIPDIVLCFDLHHLIKWEDLSVQEFRSLIETKDRIQYQSSPGKNMTNKTDVKGQSFYFKSIKTTPSNELSVY